MQSSNLRYEKILNRINNKSMDVSERKLSFKSGTISILFIKQITDRAALSDLVVKPLMQHSTDTQIKAADAIDRIVYVDNCMLETDDTKIESCLLDGYTILLFSSDAAYVVLDIKKVEKRAIPEPETMYTIRGPKDAFIEDLDTNLSLVRSRLRNESLRVDQMEVGQRTKTPIAVLYFEDVANNTCVNEIKKRIGDIDIDGLSSSGELQTFLLNRKINLFPQMGITERADMTCGALLEGKVVVIMDGSCWALIAPKVFSEYLWASDDFYLNKFFGTFLRILRVIALNLSFIVSSLYVAVISFHQDVLPSSYVISIAQSRSQVPFNPLIEVILIELIAELIRESLIRVPTKIGTAIGIVGAIIIGQAAVAAGVFSPLLLIVVSLSLISSFVPADYTIIDPFRVLKFFLIIATGTFGFLGFTLVILIILANLVSLNTFGVPYMAPATPFNFKDFIKSVVYSKRMAPKRPAYLRTKDKFRAKPNIKNKSNR